MKLLLHICCGPCVIYPLKRLREEGVDVTGLYYNPNIHPFREYRKRLETLVAYARQKDLGLIFSGDYPLEGFLRATADGVEERCRTCYAMRLAETARIAREGGYDAFSTTILYSRFQKHDLVRETGETLSREWNVPFYYEDFRKGWNEGVAVSRELEMYRQPYCGCVYSEKERFMKKGWHEFE